MKRIHPNHKVPGGLTKTVLIRIDPALLEKLDFYVLKRGRLTSIDKRPSRADVVREAIAALVAK